MQRSQRFPGADDNDHCDDQPGLRGVSPRGTGWSVVSETGGRRRGGRRNCCRGSASVRRPSRLVVASAIAHRDRVSAIFSSREGCAGHARPARPGVVRTRRGEDRSEVVMMSILEGIAGEAVSGWYIVVFTTRCGRGRTVDGFRATCGGNDHEAKFGPGRLPPFCNRQVSTRTSDAE